VVHATHTFSHPFDWEDVYRLSLGLSPIKKSSELPYGYYLPIPEYKPTMEKEIIGSVDYINKQLCPPEKKVRVFLWSGDCMPPQQAIKLTYELGIYNVNGGDTDINVTFPFLCRVSPMGINKGGYFQVYAPIQNENVYTQGWKVKDGYLRVISTFKLTETPRRLKPISIYYHFYSGQTGASLKALKTVYNWALSQETIPLYLSEYAQKVFEFRGAALAERNGKKGSFVFCSAGELNTLRVPQNWGYPNLFSSKGIVGYRAINNSLYLSLDGSRCRELLFTDKEENPLVLISSNGHIKNFRVSDDKVYIEVNAHVPAELTLKVNPESCSLKLLSSGRMERRERIVRIFSKEKSIRLEADCKR